MKTRCLTFKCVTKICSQCHLAFSRDLHFLLRKLLSTGCCLLCSSSTNKGQAAGMQAVLSEHQHPQQQHTVMLLQTVDTAVALKFADRCLHTVLLLLERQRYHRVHRRGSADISVIKPVLPDRQMTDHTLQLSRHRIHRNYLTKVLATVYCSVILP